VRDLISAMPVSEEELAVAKEGDAEYVEYRLEVRFEVSCEGYQKNIMTW